MKATTITERIQEVKEWLLWISVKRYRYERHLNNEMRDLGLRVLDCIERAAKELGEQFITDVCKTVNTYCRCSEKQAYCLARFAVNANADFKGSILDDSDEEEED